MDCLQQYAQILRGACGQRVYVGQQMSIESTVHLGAALAPVMCRPRKTINCLLHSGVRFIQ